MAAKKKTGTADSMAKNAAKGKAKPKEKVVYDSTRSGSYGSDDRSYGMGVRGGKRGRGTGPGTGERVSGNRIQSNTLKAYSIGNGDYEVSRLRTSDALPKPRAKKINKTISAAKKK